MPIADLAHALPALLLVGTLPGLCLATLLVPRWRWWERLAAAPGLSAGMAGVVGLVFHDLHLPFMAATVLPVEGAVAVAAGWRLRRRPADPEAPREPGTPGPATRWVVAAAVAAGAASSAMVATGFRDQPVPLPTDAPVHGIVANAIARTHDTLPANPDPADATAWVRPRSGFEAVAALASEVGGPDPTAEMLPLCTLTVALLPLGLAALALEATGSAAIAGLAPALGVGWAFPCVAVYLGEYPYVLDATLVAPAIVAVLRLLRRSDAARHLLLITLLMAAIWVIHGLEAVTILAVGGPLMVARTLGGDRRHALRALALAAAAAGAGAVLVALLTRMPAVPTPVAPALAGPEVPEAAVFASRVGRFGLLDALDAFIRFAFPHVIALGLFAAGVTTCLRQRRCRWALLTFVLLLGCFLDMLVTGRLARLWDLLYPWSTQDRLPSIQYWPATVLMALGTLWVLGVLAAPLRRVLAGLRARRAVTRRLPPGAGAVAAVALGLMVLGMGRDLSMYRGGVRDLGVTGPADLAVMRQMAGRLSPHAVILVDGGDDSGQWVGAVTGDVPLLTDQFLKDHPADARIVALQHACGDPRAASRVLDGVDAVFVGSRTITSPRPQHPWSLPCIARIPGLTLLAEQTSAGGTAAAFRVDHRATATTTARRDRFTAPSSAGARRSREREAATDSLRQ